MNKYITLFGSLVLLLVFTVTIKTTIIFPTFSNIAISVVLFGLAAFGFYKYLKPNKKKEKESDEPIPID
ncbi:MAG TPA: hypothetical protein VJ895_01960 [Candidatus Nanoarchaeia archaeon]|nr:hypothetical protein [Candidatus Nanoarchaeia archaeon]